MTHLDDFPSRDDNHRVQDLAETAFKNTISQCGLFIIQQEDRCDYGTDFQLEVINNNSATNIRVHAQVKGTKANALKDGSISRTVTRTNLNYLLCQPCSIYVCFHIPSKKIFFRFAEDVYREYQHEKSGWQTQKSLTINFTKIFDFESQKKLKERSSILLLTARDERISFIKSPPSKLHQLIGKTNEKVIVPANYKQAKAMLYELYNSGKDHVISNSFEQFHLELSSYPKDMMHAYMAEINLGLNGFEINRERIKSGIKEITNLVNIECFDSGSLLYCLGNAWLALHDYENARDVYNEALFRLDRPELSGLAAQCYKNLGAVMTHLSSDEDLAIALYLRALELDPNLNEAHFALALCRRKKNDFHKVLEHLDQVAFIDSSDAHSASVHGWRIEALFNIGEIDSAFREINSLVSHSGDKDWVWPWCARQVHSFGRDSIQSTKKAIKFWDMFLKKEPDNILTKKERLLCLLALKFAGNRTEIDFYSFQKQVIDIIDDAPSDAAFWWDRIGHWAQCENRWNDAESNYRKAFELEPKKYGYCLGTALNFLKRFEEAYPILLEQAEHHTPDALSWFQVAIACEGNNDIAGCLFAYHKAIHIDPEYDLAWFNLGGIYWNMGATEEAIKVWAEATERFPNHGFAKDLGHKFSQNFNK